MDLAEWKERIAAIDARLRPVANRPFSPRDVGSAPLEEAGVRAGTEALLAEILAAYRICNDDERGAIRALWATHRSFAWAASLPFVPLDAARLRDHVTLFVIDDQGLDTRDAILAIDALCEAGKAAGIDVDAVLREHLPLASDADKYGMGSTRSLLRRNLR